MSYREITPAPVAARYIQCYWILEDDAPSDAAQRIVPDGRPELILNFAQPYQSQIHGRWHAQPDSFFVGQITGPMLLRANGLTRILGIRFQPHGASQILGTPIRELTDKVARVEDISKKLSSQLQRLRDSPLSSLTRDVLDQVFGVAPRVLGGDSHVIPSAVREFQRSGGRVSVSATAEQAGLSVRQFERRFRNAVGISPKLFCRMQRFQRVFRTIEDAAEDWAGTALQFGYFDQAHLIRDFREFAGRTPTALLTEEIDLARKFVASPAMSYLSNTPAAAAI